MSVYKNDDPNHFKDAMNSIINQTYKPDEIVLVRDGPVDEKLQKEIDLFVALPIVSYIELDENIGLGKCLAIATAQAKNELLARMDSDDISLPDRFEKQVALFDDETISVVGGQIREFIQKDERIEYQKSRIVPITDKKIRKRLKTKNPMNHVTVIMRKKDLLAIGGYEDFLYHEDYLLWSKFIKRGYRLHNISENIVDVRIGKELYRRRGGYEYFKHSKNFQKYLLKSKLIWFPRYFLNVSIRFIVQVLLPTSLRGAFFKYATRKKTK